jgi:hypothetical protein
VKNKLLYSLEVMPIDAVTDCIRLITALLVLPRLATKVVDLLVLGRAGQGMG